MPIIAPQLDIQSHETTGVPSPVHASGAIVPLVHSRPCVFRKHPLSLQDGGALNVVPAPPATQA